MGKWLLVLPFLALGGALAAFLLFFQSPKREESLLTRGEGAAVYRRTCARCHGARGEGAGGLGRPLAGRALPVALIKEIVKRGKNKMPALPHLRGEALENVARYVNRLR